MADVRSMLRAERESRRITHPHASYTPSGGLLCNLCETTIKSEKAWSAHLHSTQHTLRSSRERDAIQTRDVSNGTKKRKALDIEEPLVVERKKTKPTQPTTEGTAQDEAENAIPPFRAAGSPVTVPDTTNDVEAGELEALEQQLAALEDEARQKHRVGATSAASISAPAMTAEESAARNQEQIMSRTRQRDIDAEEVREDAARALEEEFDEMQTLQDRVQRLKDRRKELQDHNGIAQDSTTELALVTNVKEIDSGKDPDSVVNSDDSDADDEDYDDDWTFGAR